jgi:hypothetical protein
MASATDRLSLEEEMDRRGARQGFEDDHGRRYFDGEAVAAANGRWEAGGFQGIERDVGHGFETHEEWSRRTYPTHVVKTPPRRRPHGRAARPATNARRRGSRRQSGSSPPRSSDDPDPEPDPDSLAAVAEAPR